MIRTEHPFAQYIRILGKGKRGGRGLTQAEATAAMRLIIEGAVESVQIGAFLMLLRIKEESAEEIAGFVQAVRSDFIANTNSLQSAPGVQLDWSSYAGKRRQLPWFILSALLLAAHGVTVLIHGSRGHKDDRVYTEAALTAVGIGSADSLTSAARNIAEMGFAYLPLVNFCPVLQSLLDLRPLLGLRSPINTITRMLNPGAAPYSLQGIFHPGYRPIHRQAATLLQQPHLAVFKGEGGETERNPDNPCLVQSVHLGIESEETWGALFNQRHLKDEIMDVRRLKALWNNDIDDEYATATVISTTAVALKLMDKAANMVEAEALARTLWQSRPKKMVNSRQTTQAYYADALPRR